MRRAHSQNGRRYEFFKILTGKRPLGRSRHRREDIIRMNLKEAVLDTRNLINSAQDGDYRARCECALNLRVRKPMRLYVNVYKHFLK